MPWPTQRGIAGVVSCLPPKFRGQVFYGESGLKQARDTPQALRGPCPARRGPFCLTVRVSTNELEVNLFQNDGKAPIPREARRKRF